MNMLGIELSRRKTDGSVGRKIGRGCRAAKYWKELAVAPRPRSQPLNDEMELQSKRPDWDCPGPPKIGSRENKTIRSFP